jgi:DNA-binding winged helix-turn-helix (wHTH) protein
LGQLDEVIRGVQGDFLINDWLVQPQINTVEKGSRQWHLEPKVMQVLVHLALHPNEVLSKDKLLETIWRDTFVGDDVLIRCISEIRYVFGDDPRSPFIIQTIPKAGYRLIAAVKMEIDTELPVVGGQIVSSNGNHSGSATAYESAASGSSPAAVDELIEPSISTNPQVVKNDVISSVENFEKTNNEALEETIAAVPSPKPSEIESPPSTTPQFFWLVALAAALVVTVCGATYYWKSIHPSPFNVFWAPVLEARERALFCVADQNQYTFITLRDAADPARQIVLKDNLSAVVIDDLDTLVRVAGILRAHGKDFLLKGEEATTLSDLRNGPAVFVGAFDNAWTLRLTKPLRYHFSNNPDMTEFRIVDSYDPSRSNWVIDRTQQMATNNYKDFAIVARFTDINTGKPAIIIAGVGRGGTIAAGEFLTDPDDLAQLIHAVQAAGNKMNLEIVLSTQIIDGQPGTPKIEATYFW